MLQGLHYDLRDGFRALRHRPAFTTVVVLTLALGIGASTAIFSVVNSVLLRPLSYRDSQRLYVIHEIIPQWANSAPVLDANLPNFQIWQKEAHSLDGIAIAEGTSMILSGVDEPEQVRGTRASANFLDLLGVRPALGRLFSAEEDLPDRGHAVILTDAFWRTHLKSDSHVVGRAVMLDGVPYTVAGVLPKSFGLPGGVNGFSTATQFFIPLNGPKFYEQDLIGEFDFTAIGRLKPDITPAQALAELNLIQSRIVKQSGAKLDLRAQVSPLQSEIVGSARRGLILLLTAVGALLLMICVNVANLLFARVPGRLREAGIRKALGASGGRLMRQMLVESLLLASVGGALGILLADYGVQWIARFGPVDIPRLSEVSVDARALAFVGVASVVTALLFGILPSWLVARADLHEIIGSAGKSATQSARTRSLRAGLVGMEVALCTVLLIVAGLLGRSLLNLLHMDPGFSVEHVLAANIDLPPIRYAKADKREAFYRSALDGIRSLPGVRSAAWIHILPLQGNGSVSGINLPGEVLSPEKAPMVNYRAISPYYFQTMGIPLLAGRAFHDNDRGKRQVIVSQSLAKRLWPTQNAVGQRCIAQWGELQLEPSEVIGIAGDIHTRLDQPPLYMVYVADSWPMKPPSAPGSAAIVVRTAQDPTSIAGPVRNAIHQAGSDVPIVALRPMSQIVELNLEGRRFQMSLTSSFATSALLLASLGIFGVLAYSVEQRRREFGIRTALGAQRSELLTMIMRQGLSPVAIGLAGGIVAALLGGSLLRSLVFGVSAFDPLTLAAVALVILLVAAIACYIPARRAISTDPIVALRYE
jgi:putative ABC transport system permease protein